MIVFLLAYASGPYFFGAPEERWLSAGAALDGIDEQIFVRDFLRKLTSNTQGMARVETSALSSGEQQVCLVLVAKGLAVPVEEDGKNFYLLDQAIHEQLLELLSIQKLPLRASAQKATMGA